MENSQNEKHVHYHNAKIYKRYGLILISHNHPSSMCPTLQLLRSYIVLKMLIAFNIIDK